MRRTFVLLAHAAAAAGCGGPVARFDKLGRVEAAMLTDAKGLAGPAAGALPPMQVTDPDRLAAIEAWLKKHKTGWRKPSGVPRATRFQLQLVGDGQPLYTVWFDPGYAQLSTGGKNLREMRLSNADTAELFACLGLPPDYLAAVAAAPGVDYGPPRRGIAKGPPLTPLRKGAPSPAGYPETPTADILPAGATAP